MRAHTFTDSQRNFFLDMSGFVTACLLFATVFGSYRIFIVYAIHSLIRALKIEKKYIAFFLPAYIVTFYLDITSGPILITSRPYFLVIFLIAFVFADPLVQILFQKITSIVTENQFFNECPSCHFNNIQLVNTCSNCAYKKGDPLGPSIKHISVSAKGDKISNGLIPLLNLAIDEELLFHKKLTSSQKLKNGERVARKHFVITTSNVIILDYYIFHIRFPKSWRERDVIPLLEINVVEGKMKDFMKSTRPFLTIKTSSDIYEIVFSTSEDYMAQITEIASILKKANSQVELTIELHETALNIMAKRFLPSRFSSQK